jgi:hypothetical protein
MEDQLEEVPIEGDQNSIFGGRLGEKRAVSRVGPLDSGDVMTFFAQPVGNATASASVDQESHAGEPTTTPSSRSPAIAARA